MGVPLAKTGKKEKNVGLFLKKPAINTIFNIYLKYQVFMDQRHYGKQKKGMKDIGKL